MNPKKVRLISFKLAVIAFISLGASLSHAAQVTTRVDVPVTIDSRVNSCAASYIHQLPVQGGTLYNLCSVTCYNLQDPNNSKLKANIIFSSPSNEQCLYSAKQIVKPYAQ